MATYDELSNGTPSNRAGVLVNYAGAAVSLALVAGVGIWGYKLVMRDVTGIPVVRAMEGAMRVAPENPGGDVARHEGLAVNEVAADGAAAAPGDTLLLAPVTTQLSEEDLAVQPMAEADEVRAADAAPATAETETPTALNADPVVPDGPLSADDILALADQIAAGAAPLTALAEGQDVAPQLAVDGEAVATAPLIDPSVPGVAVSLRPTVRPASLVTVAAPAAAPAATPSDADVVAAAVAEAAPASQPNLTTTDLTLASSIPAGTHLVQLGAFPTAEQAASEWDRLSGSFAEFMTTKNRVILEATSGGQKFYRLRASGFDQMSDARRFCAALIAGSADCIPVVTQ
ncbi:SPOR domain-containing protein [Yoonia sp. 208BN28-4]|uniref:SPOR domain-containing protein n=1 Tax=Yoonia sp. 208BN28-4 TaxID=3126505 RepID=UPI003098E018